MYWFLLNYFCYLADVLWVNLAVILPCTGHVYGLLHGSSDYL